MSAVGAEFGILFQRAAAVRAVGGTDGRGGRRGGARKVLEGVGRRGMIEGVDVVTAISVCTRLRRRCVAVFGSRDTSYQLHDGRHYDDDE